MAGSLKGPEVISNKEVGSFDGKLDDDTRTELEAATFRRLLQHLDENKDVQNIDLMNLSGFCRNCLSKWYRAAAQDKGIELDYEAVRERVYGMPYPDWKQRYQREATPEQQAEFKARNPDH